MIGQSNLKKQNKTKDTARLLKDLTENQFIQTSLPSSHPLTLLPSLPPTLSQSHLFFLPLMLTELYLTLCAML